MVGGRRVAKGEKGNFTFWQNSLPFFVCFLHWIRHFLGAWSTEERWEKWDGWHWSQDSSSSDGLEGFILRCWEARKGVIADCIEGTDESWERWDTHEGYLYYFWGYIWYWGLTNWMICKSAECSVQCTGGAQSYVCGIIALYARGVQRHHDGSLAKNYHREIWWSPVFSQGLDLGLWIDCIMHAESIRNL